MSISRFDIYQEEDRWAMMLGSPEGEYVSYEDHLLEVAKLMHIISALEGQVKDESQEIGRLKMEIAGGLDSREPQVNACVEGAEYVDHTLKTKNPYPNSSPSWHEWEKVAGRAHKE